MAEKGIGSIITIAAVGGLGYWLYSSGMLSSLFGSSAAPAPTNTGGAGAGTNPASNPTGTTGTTSGAGTNAQKPAGACAKAGVLAPWLAIVQKAQPSGNFGAGLPGTLTIDEWCYYGNQYCTGICDQNGLTADALFPGQDDRGGPMNWSAFLGRAQAAGLSGLC